MKKVLLTLLSLLLLLGGLPAAYGEHEPSHRYFVSGFVVYDGGMPACGITVQAEDRQATTDSRGWYRIQLHLHDGTVSPTENDVGKSLVVSVVGTGISKSTTATPSQADNGWGESRVDFEVPSSITGVCTNPLLQAGLYIGVPLAVILGTSVAYIKLLRPRLQRRPSSPSLSSLPGIGKGRERELRNMGITTVQDLANAQPS
ncbi:MAG: hypothetical protein GTO63_17900, partial [Anaerolineae bacterium]|nr:hypothetical protein [Anaerolineae bacterium]NIN96676.1 hypothetical protein [Anaerolineae bacterium]